ncbi:hypothetical protein KPL74_04625 [Bacillus sp. NP157]|nr:hypothetical protein KPL74_04625 [Bacillus sp. NP157]
MRQTMTVATLALCVSLACHATDVPSIPTAADVQQASADTLSPRILVHPMTTVDPSTGVGYFQDPYPIHTSAPDAKPGLPVFSGTTQQLLSCPGVMRPDCFSATRVTLDPGPFAAQAAAQGATINNFEGLNIFQDDAGTWQMAVTAHLKKGTGDGWNVVMHAHARGQAMGVPTAWVADTLLVGDLGRPAPDNYNGKYFADNGTLYLIYNKKVGEGQDAVVAQVMLSPTQKGDHAPVPLLGPETANGGYNSELADGLNQPNAVKLVETGNVTKIDGKYVMTYSVGTFNRRDYKSGIAWSDTFLPPSGTYYRRVEQPDTAGVWGQANHSEVRYLLQSQIPAWPNYVGGQVLAPGVPSIVRGPKGAYFLAFAGYDPSDAPTNDKGLYKGPHRRPYYVRLDVHVPGGKTVVGASMRELAGWVEPARVP